MSQHLAHPAGANLSPDLLRTGFDVGSDRSDGIVVLRLYGELDMATATELRRALAEAIGCEPSVVVDLADLSFIDSTGIGVLVGASRLAEDAGCSFVLRSPSRSVRKALRLTGVDQVMRIEAPALN